MSRLIDADALVKDGYVLHRTYRQDEKTMVYETKRIEDIPTAQPKQQWIPCSERLPEETEARYWVCTDGGYQCQCRWTNDVFGLGEGDTWTWKIFDIPQYSKVIAWMPLPEPARLEGE